MVDGTNTRVSTRAGPMSVVTGAPVPMPHTALSCLHLPELVFLLRFPWKHSRPLPSDGSDSSASGSPHPLPSAQCHGHRRKGGRGQGKTQAGCLPAESWRQPTLHLPLQAVGGGQHPVRGHQRASAEVHPESGGTGREFSSDLTLCPTGSRTQHSVTFVRGMFPKERPPARHQGGQD